MDSIYIETEKILSNQQAVEWLDGCGATWVDGTPFQNYRTEKYFLDYSIKGFAHSNKITLDTLDKFSTHTPTALEFCQGVARIMGIPEPTFGGAPNIINITPGTERKMLYLNHKTYRILDSLDGIPLDTRIPLSEWIPPFLVNVILIYDNKWSEGFFSGVEGDGLLFQLSDKGCKYILDGHWMRIV